MQGACGTAVRPTAASSYGPVANIASRDIYVDPQIAVAADGSGGFATWSGVGSSTIKVVLLDPQPEAESVPPAPGPPASAPVGRRVPSVPGPQPPRLCAGATEQVTRSERSASFSLTIPRGCVRAGQRFDATLGARRKKRKGNLFVKFRRVDFHLGSKRVKIDRRAPFVHGYRIVATQPSGSTIKVRARAYINVKRGKSPTKSLRATVRIC